jgi:hypothetical protein
MEKSLERRDLLTAAGVRDDGMTMALSVCVRSRAMNIRRALPVIGAVALGIALTPGLVVTPSSAEPRSASDSACAQRVYARLFFGLEGPHGSVDEAEWETFLRDVVVPRFPGGLTITHAKGHWQAPGEPLQREASRVLEIVFDERPHDRRIDEIAAAYKAAYQQDSVMVIRMSANVCF